MVGTRRIYLRVSVLRPFCCKATKSAAHMGVDRIALAWECTLEEGPQEGIKRVHSSDIGSRAEDVGWTVLTWDVVICSLGRCGHDGELRELQSRML